MWLALKRALGEWLKRNQTCMQGNGKTDSTVKQGFSSLAQVQVIFTLNQMTGRLDLFGVQTQRSPLVSKMETLASNSLFKELVDWLSLPTSCIIVGVLGKKSHQTTVPLVRSKALRQSR